MSAALLSLLFVGLALGIYRADKQRQQEEDRLQAQIALQEHASNPGRISGDFADRLPRTINSERIVADLNRSAQQQGVQILALTIQDHPSAPNELGRTEIQFSMSSDYRLLKTVFAKLQESYPSMVLSQISLQAAVGDPSRQEARGVLLFFYRN